MKFPWIFFLLVIFIPLFLLAITVELKSARQTVFSKQSQKGTLAIATKKILTITPSKIPVNTVYLGMWTEGFWNENTYSLHPEALTTLQNQIGKKVAIAHYYRGWENLGKESFRTELETIQQNGWRPMVSANPYFFSQCSQGSKNIYRTIADGDCDAFLQTIGKTFKTFNKPVFLRFAWEMNIGPIDWSTQKTQSTPNDFVQAWRRFHEIVVSQGATNVLWVWSPNVNTGGSIAYSSLYPGDSYVDWLGLDGYNWGTSKSWTHWESFSEIFQSSYQALVGLAPAKPIMIAETNTTDQGGNKAMWYQDMISTQLLYNFPKIKAVIFYNEDRSKQEQVNWLITVSPASLDTFSRLIKNPNYLSSF